jgi:hypothetical protein
MIEPEIMLSVFPLKAPGNFQMELITFTMAFTRTKFSESKRQELYSYLPNAKNLLYSGVLGQEQIRLATCMHMNNFSLIPRTMKKAYTQNL